MAISQRAKDLTENIYICYGSDTGWLFGVSPDLRFAVEAIVQSVLDQVGDGDPAPQLLEALEKAQPLLEAYWRDLRLHELAEEGYCPACGPDDYCYNHGTQRELANITNAIRAAIEASRARNGPKSYRPAPPLRMQSGGTKMANHTPGPWRMVKTHVPDRFFVDTESVPHKAITGWGNVRQLEGDARLIAAAPRLLEALEKVVAQFDGIADDKWPTQGMKVAIEDARAAIADATGEDRDG